MDKEGTNILPHHPGMEVHSENHVAMKLNIVCVAFERTIPLRILLDSLLVQTDARWDIKIIHDGPASKKVKDIVGLPCYTADPRINFTESPARYGKWGHPNRKNGLSGLAYNHSDFVLITNDDNYYVPMFVEIMLRTANSRAGKVGMVYCDTVHSYQKYSVLSSRIAVGSIDMGSFIVRNDIAKKVGFVHNQIDADGMYASECAAFCRKIKLAAVHVEKPLFVHN